MISPSVLGYRVSRPLLKPWWCNSCTGITNQGIRHIKKQTLCNLPILQKSLSQNEFGKLEYYVHPPGHNVCIHSIVWMTSKLPTLLTSLGSCCSKHGYLLWWPYLVMGNMWIDGVCWILDTLTNIFHMLTWACLERCDQCSQSSHELRSDLLLVVMQTVSWFHWIDFPFSLTHCILIVHYFCFNIQHSTFHISM